MFPILAAWSGPILPLALAITLSLKEEEGQVACHQEKTQQNDGLRRFRAICVCCRLYQIVTARLQTFSLKMAFQRHFQQM
ncbi:hypothetical protein [Dyella sp. 2HG41-7]|uniref:hypothetical protein n=1 Tax=Dyella sp. 2HG41-7 TaxID=2883239 RepID=UPI001F413F47|nr:hypothetical protein [Dyella sp. 2HG41-7]